MTLAPRAGGLGGDGIALLAAAAVGDHSHRVDRFAGAPGGNHDANTGEVPGGRGGRQDRVDRGDDALRGGQTPGTHVAAGESPLLWVDDVDTSGAKGGDVGHHGRVLPHLGVHRRAHHDRGPGGEQGVGEQVGGKAGRVSADQPGRGRGDDDEVGRLPEPGVRNRIGFVPQAGLHRLAGECRQGCTPEEALGALGHDRHHMSARIDKAAAHIDSLVRRDAPGDTEHDALAGEHGPVF